MKYRPDIAGLRAVAVLPILLFHAGVSALSGGFVGVDIFFVISGYLITTIIQSEISTDSFSMMEFYRRRVARIVPALVAVLIATLVAGAFMMLPPEVKLLAPSAASAAAFVSNLYFFFTADYFGAAAETLPLLHTWSLAIEEQFYIFFPIILLLVHRTRMLSAKSTVAIVSLLSLGASFAFARLKPEAAFYLIPARAWELGIGAFVALGGFPHIRSSTVRNFAAIGGLVLILISVLTFIPGPLFPAPLALLPCLGTALLVAYGRDAITSPLLSLGPMRFVGDISYSLYLWHWPIITFYRLQTGIELDWTETLALVFASFLVAVASYRWIERPCLAWLKTRTSGQKSRQVSRSAVVYGGIGVQAIVCGAAFLLPGMASQLKRWPDEVVRYAAHVDYRQSPDYVYQYRRGTCFFGASTSKRYNWDCLKVSKTKDNLVVLGDSHGAQYWRAFSERYPEYHVIQATNSGCRPVLNTTGEKLCTDVVRYVLGKLINKPGIRAAVLAARWRDSEVDDLLSTIRYLRERGISVLVIGPTVEYDLDFPLVMARSALHGDLSQIARHRIESRRLLDERMAPLVRGAGATYVSAFSLECPSTESCTLVDRENSAPYHFDYGHLTLHASRELVARMPEIN